MASFDQNSKVAGHVHLFGNHMNFENVEVVGFESNYHERLFREGLTLYFGPELWERSYPTSGSLQRHCASISYMVARASFASRYFHLRMTTNFVIIH